jgi:16S rRNA (adenine1518-N6/adenine1519-N6)-dimethyltransferase
VIDPADQEQLEALLAGHGARPVKRLGQNFLVDAELRDRVAAAAGVEDGDTVLEVGAGAGTLSLRLAEKARRLLCVEIDPRLAAALGDVLAGRDNVEILRGDVLALDLPAVDLAAGNIPYYLTGKLLPRLLERRPAPRRLSLVVQREVAERWTSAGDWSLSSLAVQVYTEPRLEFTLPAEAFWPRPAVDSACVTLRVRERAALPASPAFFAFAERIFQFRRKQLGAILSRLGEGEAAARLTGLGIDPRRRPQTLGLEEWARLFEEFTA